MSNKGICIQCGKEFEYKKRKDGKGYIVVKYCSTACSKQHYKENEGKNYGIGVCEYCGKEFLKEKKISGRGYKQKKFCSVECEKLHHEQVSKEKYGWGTCVVCGKKFEREKTACGGFSQTMFCSDFCKNKYADIKYPNRVNYCTYCGKRIELRSYGTKVGSYTVPKFCNNVCEKKYYSEIYGKMKCKSCGKEFLRPSYIDNRGYREYKRGWKLQYCEDCRKMLPRDTELEQMFAELLQQNDIDYDIQEFNLENSWFDFHISNFNILIDINPTYTHTCINNALIEGKYKNYHYDRVELAAKYGYIYICIWDWTNKEDIIKIIKYLMKTKYFNKKHILSMHNMPDLVYCDSHNGNILEEKYIPNEIEKHDNYYPIYTCGKYKYAEIEYIFE